MSIRKNNKRKKGFTLIELIIVIAIIAILAAIAIPNFLSIQRKSKVKADIASAKTVYDATSALIAEGQIIAPATGNITLTLNSNGTITGGESTGTSSVENGTDAQDLQNYLQTVPVPESMSGKTFNVTITGPESNPVIKVNIDTTLVYPNGEKPYNLNETTATANSSNQNNGSASAALEGSTNTGSN